MPAGNIVETPEVSEARVKFPGYLIDHLRTIENANKVYDTLTKGDMAKNEPESVGCMLEQWRGRIEPTLACLCMEMTQVRFNNDAAKDEEYTQQAWPIPHSDLMPEDMSERYKLLKHTEEFGANQGDEEVKIPEVAESQPLLRQPVLPEEIAIRELSDVAKEKRRKPGQAVAEIVLVLQINEKKWMTAREIAEEIGGQAKYNSVAADLSFIIRAFKDPEKLTGVVHDLITERGYRLETRTAKVRRSPCGPLPKEYRLVSVSYNVNSVQ